MKSLFTLTRNEPARKVFGMSSHSQGENIESGLLRLGSIYAQDVLLKEVVKAQSPDSLPEWYSHALVGRIQEGSR